MVLVVSEEVREAVDSRRPVVALESTIIAHGLPRPRDLRVARELEAAVRQEGAVPATIAVLDGRPRVGLGKEQLERIANEDGIRELGHRDLPLAVTAGVSGVSATASLAAGAGIRVFATGGLGGVHREWTATQDESAGLGLLARTRVTVVCAGVKPVLDVPATPRDTTGAGDAFTGAFLAAPLSGAGPGKRRREGAGRGRLDGWAVGPPVSGPRRWEADVRASPCGRGAGRHHDGRERPP